MLEVKTSGGGGGGGDRFFNFSSFSAASKVRFLSSLEVGGVEVSTKTWEHQPLKLNWRFSLFSKLNSNF